MTKGKKHIARKELSSWESVMGEKTQPIAETKGREKKSQRSRAQPTERDRDFWHQSTAFAKQLLAPPKFG